MCQRFNSCFPICGTVVKICSYHTKDPWFKPGGDANNLRESQASILLLPDSSLDTWSASFPLGIKA